MPSKEEFLLSVGQKIDAIRQEKGLSFQELANLADIEKSNLVKITKGDHNITLSTLYNIAKGLEIGVRDLLSAD